MNPILFFLRRSYSKFNLHTTFRNDPKYNSFAVLSLKDILMNYTFFSFNQTSFILILKSNVTTGNQLSKHFIFSIK